MWYWMGDFMNRQLLSVFLESNNKKKPFKNRLSSQNSVIFSDPRKEDKGVLEQSTSRTTDEGAGKITVLQ